MYDNVYQEYINNMLGTIPKTQPDIEFDTYRNSNYFQSQNPATNAELEQLYPDLYKLLYPMIQTACMKNTKPITEEAIEEMVNDIYSNFITEDNTTTLNINLTNNVRTASKSNDTQTSLASKFSSKTTTETRQKESEETRVVRPNNFVLNDLIRILLIRELLGRPGNFPPNRPGFPPQRPGPGRPPFRPRDFGAYSQDIGIYEEPHMYSNFNNNSIF